jgi:hypothetical protein
LLDGLSKAQELARDGDDQGNRNYNENVLLTSFDKICDTVASFLAFLVDDWASGLHKAVCVDLINTLEDLSVLQVMYAQYTQTSLPVRLTLFCETSLIARNQNMATRPKEETQEFSMELHGWDELFVLQSAFLKILNSVVAQFALIRHQEMPDVIPRIDPMDGEKKDRGISNTPLSSGTTDLFFPPDLVLDYSVIPSLLMGLKAVLLIQPPAPYGRSVAVDTFSLDSYRKDAAFKILVMLQNDWQGLGRTCASLSQAIILEASILVLRALQVPFCVETHQKDSLRDQSLYSVASQIRFEEMATNLVARMVSDAVSLHCLETTALIHGQILPVLLDGLYGMAAEIGALDDRSWSLNIASHFLKASHVILTSDFDLARLANQHVLAHGMYRHLISLLLRSCSSASHSFDYWAIQLIASLSMTEFNVNNDVDISDKKRNLENAVLVCLDWYNDITSMETTCQTGTYPNDRTSQEPFWTTIQSLQSCLGNRAGGTDCRAAAHFGTLISLSDARAWGEWVKELPATWYHAIGYMITEAFDAALYLSRHLGNATVSVQDVKPRLFVLRSCLLLLMHLVRCEHFRSTSILKAADVLAKSILAFCSSFNDASEMHSSTLAGLNVDTMVQCGLAIHFSKLPLVDSRRDTYNHLFCLLDSSSALSLELLASPSLSHMVTEGTFCPCLGLPSYLVTIASKLHDPPGLNETAFLCLPNDQNFVNCSWAVLHALPLKTRAGLLVSLHVSPHCSSKTVASKILTDIKNHLALPDPRTGRFQSASILLHALPLFYQATLQKSVADDYSLTRSRVVSTLFDDILVPLLSCRGDCLASIEIPFLVALRHVQNALHDGVVVDIYDPGAALDMLTVRHESLQNACFEGQMIESLFKVVFDIFYSTHHQSINSTARYLLWTVIANCLISAPMHVRTYLKVKQKPSFGNVLYKWIRDVPFIDHDRLVRQILSVGAATLWTASKFSEVFEGFGYSEADSLSDGKDTAADQLSLTSAPSILVDDLLNLIATQIKECCDFSDTQLPLSIGITSNDMSSSGKSICMNRFAMQRQATTFLAVICFNAQLVVLLDTRLFEMSLMRLLRLWFAPSLEKALAMIFPAPLSVSGSNALAFGCLSVLSDSCDLSPLLSSTMTWTYFPRTLFADLLCANSIATREELCHQAEQSIQMLVASSEGTLECLDDLTRAYNRISVELPHIIAQILVCEEEEVVRFVVTFYCYLRAKKKTAVTGVDRPTEIVGSSAAVTNHIAGTVGVTVGTSELDKVLKDFCLGNVDVILPALLLPSRHAPLKFLSKITGLTLGEMIENREQGILRGIVWELGRDPDTSTDAIFALKTAALARLHHDQMIDCSDENQRATSAAKNWVTERFMFLFVNMLQLNWRSRTMPEQVWALRCFFALLDFLHERKAAQSLPQVLTTLNGAINDGCKETDRDGLAIHAVKCLGKFVRLVAQHNPEAVIVGNLPSIVVSVIPVIEEYDRNVISHPQARDEAVSLLDFLVSPNFIDEFPHAFSEIPFILDSPLLNTIHQRLRDKGIVFDNLSVVSVDTITKEVPENSSSDSVRSVKGGGDVLALRKRLSLVSCLLGNENSSVKGITLKHLHALLRSHRALLHELIYSEGRASPKDFLTISTVAGSQHGIISDLIEKLIRRCATEVDDRIRLQIASCLGEIGAVAEHNLEGMTLYRSKRDDFVTMHRWRLRLPPWQTSAEKYELKLVTQHLVAALKTASSAEEQVRIAHSIQQLLILLDMSARVSIDDSEDLPKKQPMSHWLNEQLRKANVFEVVESFWFSEFSVKVNSLGHHPLASYVRLTCLFVYFCNRRVVRTPQFGKTAALFLQFSGVFQMAVQFLPLDDIQSE